MKNLTLLLIMIMTMATTFTLLGIPSAEASAQNVERAKQAITQLKVNLSQAFENLPPNVAGHVWKIYRDVDRDLDGIYGLLNFPEVEQPQLCPVTMWTCTTPNAFSGPGIGKGTTEVEARGNAIRDCRLGRDGFHCHVGNTECDSTIETRPCSR